MQPDGVIRQMRCGARAERCGSHGRCWGKARPGYPSQPDARSAATTAKGQTCQGASSKALTPRVVQSAPQSKEKRPLLSVVALFSASPSCTSCTSQPARCPVPSATPLSELGPLAVPPGCSGWGAGAGEVVEGEGDGTGAGEGDGSGDGEGDGTGAGEGEGETSGSGRGEGKAAAGLAAAAVTAGSRPPEMAGMALRASEGTSTCDGRHRE